MKVLAIRGANLASLEGEFELALDHGPLARAGVFAICGPTGAGKTTLLDAMCLALFDTAPRLDASRRVRVGGEADDDRLTTRDPRSVLRKGAGRGWAEVDFEGADGRVYRARWEVRRARERADGKMQSSAMSLVDLSTEQRWAGRKTDVKTEIEARLGLSFDQFRRSVLLAQGDFAAFLDADPRERADLLERMTGTAIYGLISQEAHARAGEETRKLELAAERLRAVPELTEAERAELARRRDQLAIQVRADELQVSDATAALRWHHELDGLRREEAEAQAERQRILGQLALAEAWRHELAAHEAALPLRPHLDAISGAEASLTRRRQERDEARGRAERARGEVTGATEAAKAARAALDGAAEDREASRERVEHARALDRAIEERATRHAALVKEAAEAARRAATAEAGRRALSAQVEAASADGARAEEWLAAHPEAAALEADWARADEHLERVLEVSAQLEALSAARDAAQVDEREAGHALAAREGAWMGAARVAAEARAEQESLRERSAAAPPAELAEEARRWAARRTALETLIGLADRAQQAQGAQRRHEQGATRAVEAAEAAERSASEARGSRSRAAAKLEEALAQRDRVRATLDLAERRADLRPGEPCPLCGAEAHPYAHEAPAVNALLEASDARTRELREEVSTLDAAIADAAQRAESARAEAGRAREEAAAWGRELDLARERYRAAARELDGPWPEELGGEPVVAEAPTDWGPLFALVSPGDASSNALLSDDARAALEEARAVAIEELKRLSAREAARRALEAALERGREAHEAAQIAQEQAREALDEARGRAAEARDASERAAAALARAEGERARSAGRLADVLQAFDGWRARLDADPAGFAAQLRDAVSARRTWLEVARRAERAVSERRPALEGATVEHREAARAAERATAEVADAAAGLEAVRAERRQVLGGASADEAEARARAALERARGEAERADEALRLAHRHDAEAAARAERADVAVIEAEALHDRVHEELAAALEEAGVDRATAEARLARDPAELEALRAELRRLDERRAEQTEVLAERARRREQHEATDAPSLDPVEAAAALSAAQLRLTDTRELFVAVRGRLESDAEARARATELRRAMADQMERLATWTTLADLIGSANGNKLRVFAQSLTLELLLEHANHHLRDLAPRYGLSRIPGEDLALQVIDHEMGDEVRAVTSLSGGESFLVALGLALGLASLSSQQARVDSLFIDEGFGALDPGSLEMVLSTLDVLQSSGRQVGLISHVPAVAERFDTRVQVTPAGPARSRVELIVQAHSL